MRLQGAFLDGSLDLIGCRISGNIDLKQCHFNQKLFLTDAFIDGLVVLDGSFLAKGLDAEGLRARAIFMRNGFHSQGSVRVLAARIDGNIEFTGGKIESIDRGIEPQENDAFSADNASITGSLFLRQGFSARGMVRLTGAQIGGDLDCSGGDFRSTNFGTESKNDIAITAIRIIVNGSVLLRNQFKSKGAVNISGAKIRGNLECTRAHLEAVDQEALCAEKLSVEGSVFLCEDFKAIGSVRLLGARIGGDLDCVGATLESKGSFALSAEKAIIGGNILLSENFKTKGQIRLLATQIGGNLDCNGGNFDSSSEFSINADSSVINGTFFLGKNFWTNGQVRLVSAQIRGDLVCDGGFLETTSGNALQADRALVSGGVFLRDGFKATGSVSLTCAEVGKNLECDGAEIQTRGGTSLSLDGATIDGSIFLRRFFSAGAVNFVEAAVNGSLEIIEAQIGSASAFSIIAERLVVKNAFFLKDLRKPVRINLGHAEVRVLADELSAWAPDSIIKGLKYDTLNDSLNAEDRIKWILMQQKSHLTVDFTPQPWRQLQRVLQDLGKTTDAKHVGISLEKHLRSTGRLTLLERSFHYLFGALAGYGYQPLRLINWVISIWLTFGLMYWWLALPPRSALAPTDPLIFHHPSYAECLPNDETTSGNWYLCEPLRGEYSTFSPFAFSLDVLLPLVDLGQEKSWGAFVPTPKANLAEELFMNFDWGHVVRMMTWFQIIFGWVASLIFVAIISGVSKRTEDST